MVSGTPSIVIAIKLPKGISDDSWQQEKNPNEEYTKPKFDFWSRTWPKVSRKKTQEIPDESKRHQRANGMVIYISIHPIF
jgi:hypothetical protein